MHRSPWALVAHSSFIEGSHLAKKTASSVIRSTVMAPISMSLLTRRTFVFRCNGFPKHLVFPTTQFQRLWFDQIEAGSESAAITTASKPKMFGPRFRFRFAADIADASCFIKLLSFSTSDGSTCLTCRRFCKISVRITDSGFTSFRRKTSGRLTFCRQTMHKEIRSPNEGDIAMSTKYYTGLISVI